MDGSFFPMWIKAGARFIFLFSGKTKESVTEAELVTFLIGMKSIVAEDGYDDDADDHDDDNSEIDYWDEDRTFFNE